MNKQMTENMATWTKKFGLDINAGPTDDKLKWAMDPKLDINSLDLAQTGDLLFALSSYHYTLAAQMGRVYAIMRHDNDPSARFKLNVIKPQHDSLELKISVVKKLFDRRANEHRRANANAT
jgi:hypothetical protein